MTTDLPDWARTEEPLYPPDAPSPSWGPPPGQAQAPPPPPAADAPFAAPRMAAPTANYDEIELNAHKLNFLVVPPEAEVDVEAARLVGRTIDGPVGEAQTGIGLMFTPGDGHLVVAWPDLPTPSQVKALEMKTGHSIYPAVAGKVNYTRLNWRANELLDGDHFRVSLDPLVDTVLDQTASDLHVATGERPWMRVGSTFRPIKGQPPLTADDMLVLVRQVVGEDFDPAKFDGDLDLSITFGSTRFRVNLYRAKGQLGMALRTIPIGIPDFDNLGLPASARKFTALRDGLVIIGGATGSGKTTSLAAILDLVNEEREVNIFTLEAPIEYIHSSKRAMFHQREIGDDTVSFQRALKSVLREDPDVILVGEMRDYEEMSLAITAAETGHLVFVTVHAHNFAGVVDRIIDVFPSDSQNQVRAQLANILRGVMCQKLLPDMQDSRRRHLAYEIGFVNDAVRSVIRDKDKPNDRITEALMAGRKDEGMQPFDGSLAVLVAEGKVHRDEAARHSVKADIFQAIYEAEIRKRRAS